MPPLLAILAEQLRCIIHALPTGQVIFEQIAAKDIMPRSFADLTYFFTERGTLDLGPTVCAIRR